MPKKVSHVFDTTQATINQLADPARLAPNEFRSIINCRVDGRTIRWRDRTKILDLTGLAPGGTSVISMYACRNLGVAGDWLVCAYYRALGDGSLPVYLAAFLIERNQYDGSVTILRTRLATSPGYPYSQIGAPWSFWTYGSLLYASNGFELAVFDGQRWTMQAAATHFTTIAARCGQTTAGGRMTLLGTEHYPDEVTWADAYADIKVDTPWTGTYREEGGILTPNLMNAIDVVSVNGQPILYVAGDGNQLLVSTDLGLSWKTIAVPAGGAGNVLSVLMVSLTTSTWTGYITLGSNVYAKRDSTSLLEKWDATTISEVGPFSDPFSGILRCSTIAIHEVGMVLDEGIMLAGYYVDTGSNYATSVWYDHTNHYWIQQSPARTDEQFMAIASVPNTSTLIGAVVGVTAHTDNIAGANGHIYREAIGLAGWVDPTTPPFPSPSTTKADWYGVCFDSINTRNVFYVCGFSEPVSPGLPLGQVWKSNDGGDIWFDISPANFGHPIYAVSAYDGQLWAVGALGNIMRYDDTTGSWEVQASTVQVDLHSVKFTSLNDGYAVGDDGTYIFTRDGGETWLTPNSSQINPTRFNDNLAFNGGEQIRGVLKHGGLWYIGTDRNIQVVNPQAPQFDRQFTLEDFDIPHGTCMAEFGDTIWLLGRDRGIPGLYQWNGSEARPVIMSKTLQDEFANACLFNSYRVVDTIYDNEQDFTPKGTTGQNGGIGFDTTKWRYTNGLLTLKRGESGPVFSNASVDGSSADDTWGIQIENIRCWGFFCIELAMNDNENASVEPPTLNVYTRIATGTPPGLTWGGWTTLSPMMPQQGQSVAPGRYLYAMPPNFIVGANWMQWKIVASNTTTGNVIINRIAIRNFVGVDDQVSPSVPCLIAAGDTLRAFFDTLNGDGTFSGKCIAITRSGDNLFSCVEDYTDQGNTDIRKVASAAYIDGTLFLGMSRNGDNLPEIQYTVPDVNTAAAPYSQEFTTGHIHFDSADPLAASCRKDITRIYLGVEPAAVLGISPVMVRLSWCADRDIRDDDPYMDLTFPLTISNDTIADKAVTQRVIELSPDEAVIGSHQEQQNSGKYFVFRLKSHADGQLFTVTFFKVDATLYPEFDATDFQNQ